MNACSLRNRRAGVLALVVLRSATAHADLRPRIGQISDEVALQRYGWPASKNPRVLRREGTEIIAQGNFQGREATLRLDALRGGWWTRPLHRW